jgi:thiol-disulfide isomerase/thioredoxin/mono/diheme cytochrome c family protein
MGIRQSKKWTMVCISVPCVALGLLRFVVAQPSAFASETSPASSVSSDLRQRARLLRPADHGVGRYIADISFSELDGKQRSLSEFKDRQFVVVAMTSTSCPLSKKYLPTLVELAKKYSAQGVQFIAVNCVPTDNADAMKSAAQSFGTTASYVYDAHENLSRHVGAMTTTDVLVLDPSRTVAYHGAIDDQYGIGYALDAPRHTFLATALDSLLAGKTPEVAATAAPGCVLDHEAADSATTAVTYHNRISRIVQQNCIECHRTGGVGPFPLDTYGDVVAHAPMIRDVIERGSMPPWFAAKPATGHASVWANDRSLSDADKNDMTTWIKGSRTEGDAADAPIPRTFADEWTLGKPDYIVQLPKPIAIKATGTMPYQFVTTETTLAEDKWVQGYEILPTDRSVVHHVLVNVHEKGTGRIRDREEGIGGYWAAYVPGNAGQLYPDGFARKLPAGATVSFQIHYTPNGQATEDQLKMGLIFAKSEPKYVVTTIPLADPDLNILPGEANHVETITRPVPVDINVMGYMAHMHVRGKAFNFELTMPDGNTETLLDIPRYDFNWQLRYDYREPRVIPKGSRVKVTAVFDNSDGNPANPDPTKLVHWGPQTYEEMLIGYVETYAPIGEQRLTMRSGSGPGAAMFTALDADGDNMVSKDEAKKAIDRVPRLKDNPAILERLFDRVDQNDDGKLTPEEFEELRQQIRNGR